MSARLRYSSLRELRAVLETADPDQHVARFGSDVELGTAISSAGGVLQLDADAVDTPFVRGVTIRA